MRYALRRQLEQYEPTTLPPEQRLTEAGVLVLLFDSGDEPHIVFQKRSHLVRDHKGEISFPGGARHDDDPDLAYTALRETHEEIGVEPAHVELMGQLDDIVTISGYAVTPFVGWLDRYPYQWVFSPIEVAGLLEVPVAHLRDPANYVPDRRRFQGQWRELPSYRFGDDLIWGATARMLTNFLDLWELAAREGVEG